MTNHGQLIDDFANTTAGAKGSQDGSYSSPGHYYVRIDQVKVGESPNNGPFAAIEYTVIRTLAPGNQQEFADKGFETEAPRREGEDATHMMMRKHKSFAGNLKAAALTILEVTEEEAGHGEPPDLAKQQKFAEAMKGLFGETQPAAGFFMELKCRYILTQKNKSLFTKHSWKRRLHPADLFEEGMCEAEEAASAVQVQVEQGVYSKAEADQQLAKIKELSAAVATE